MAASSDHGGMRWMVIAVALLASSCMLRTVRQQDIASWSGASAAELQTHHLFSTIPKSVERLPDGAEMWTYSNCGTRKTATVCSPVGNTVICNGGHDAQYCCHNQFLVRGAAVEWYRTVGRCYTDCSVRPPSRPCGG